MASTPATLWPLRQARAAEGTTREPQLTPEGEALLARRRAERAGVDPPMPLLQPLNRPPSPPRQPKLLQGQSYQVVLRNLWRLLNSGYSLEQARPLVLKLARLTVFPPRPATFFAELFSDAVALGYTGTEQDLADQFLDRYERARLVAADLEEISHDHSWRQILVEISKFGGINPAKEGKGGFQGEVEWLMEGLRWGSGVIRRGRRAGQSPVQSAGLRGGGGLVPAPGIVVRKGGHSLDTVREHLQQDPRWRHLDNLTDLLVILEDAVLKGHAENTGEVVTVGSAPSVWSTLEGLFEVKPGSQWWTNRAAAPAAPRRPAEELARSWEEGGDTSFNPDEFFQRLFGTPLFDLVDQDVADEAARVEADAVAELPPPAVVPVPEAIVLPPPGELLTRTDYNASLRTTYFDEAGTPRATTSRVAPQTAAIRRSAPGCSRTPTR